MSKSERPGEFTGRNGDKIYYKVGNQLRCRTVPKKGFSKKVKRDPAFKGLRDFGSLLSKASSMGKMIRESFMDRKEGFFDMDTHHRLTALLQKAIKEDEEIIVKDKKLLAQNARLLAGFRFSEVSTVSRYFPAYKIENENGRNVLKVDFVDPKAIHKFPYAQVSVLIGGYDFAKIQGEVVAESRKMYELEKVRNGFTLDLPEVSLEEGLVYFIMLQLEPYILYHKEHLRMYEKEYQCLEVVDVLYMGKTD